MQIARRWTTADLEQLPDPHDGTRYEIIGGDLIVTHQPSLAHQYASDGLVTALRAWSQQSGLGIAFSAPGIIFADDDNVAPDVVWISASRFREAVGADQKLHAAPDLVVEVLSPGAENERRDREAKLGLYARRGVHEYWIVDPHRRQVEQYRREGAVLRLVGTLGESDRIESPLLPGFTSSLSNTFFPKTF